MDEKTRSDSQLSSEKQVDDFAREAEQRTPGVLRELVDFLRDSRKWWLTPIILALLLVGAIVILGGTAMAPFIYTLF
jgi:hypothetical protein